MSREMQAAQLADSIDFAVITIRDDEFRAVLRYFPPRIACRGRRTYDIAEFEAANGQSYRAALVRTAEQGHLSAQAVASDLIADLAPTWIVLVGIGGAVPETEFSLGDVVLATRLHDFSLTAAIAGGHTELDVRGGPAHRAVQDLIVRLPVLEAQLGEWNSSARLAMMRPPVATDDEDFKGDAAWQNRLRQAIHANFGTPELAARLPRAIAAAMASGNMLMKDPTVLQRWLADARSIKTIEMELPGVYEAARSADGDIPVLAVRGISDVVGFRRNPSWTAYACATAASFTAALLNLGLFEARPKREPLGDSRPTAAASPTLTAHLDRLRNWSEKVQFSMMPTARDVEQHTIPLTFSGTPRKFRRAGRGGGTLSEAELLGSQPHVLILGTPGAGKTTTIKRLCRSVLNDVDTSGTPRRTPLLVRLRDCNQSAESPHPVLVRLAEDVGLRPRIEKGSSYILNGKTREHSVICDTGRIEYSLPQRLNELHAIVFLDGLDEVNPALRDRVEEDISDLMAASKYFRVIVTCRSGEHVGQFGYLSTLEVCDLSNKDIEVFATAWLSERGKSFLDDLRRRNLNDLARRPLFLAHMLNLFHLGGYLPEQPYEIYGLITQLCIREWDRERGIARTSRYADFGADKKLHFLSALSFELTYNNRLKVFSERDLIATYKKIRRKFNLPEDEAAIVASEIESHTGIILEVGFGSYEFSHLTIQEYLAADYLVRSPFPSRKVAAYLQQHPDPLAIATVLSSDPAQWLAGVLMNRALIVDGKSNLLVRFLERLQQEHPIFVGGEALGLCILGLCFRAADTTNGIDQRVIEDHIAVILDQGFARRSFADAVVARYSLTVREDSDRFFMATRREIEDGSEDLAHDIDLPATGKVLRSWFERNFSNRELMYNGIAVIKRR
jgi:nucleoside phosphorylase